MGQCTGDTGVGTITTERYPRIPGISGPTPKIEESKEEGVGR